MRSSERNRVTVDRCRDCHGVFLDRDALEALLDAEAGYYAAVPVTVIEPLPEAAGDAPYGTAWAPRRLRVVPSEGYDIRDELSRLPPERWPESGRRRRLFLRQLLE